MFICLLILISSASMDIWRLPLAAKNGPKIGQKYSVLNRILNTLTFKSYSSLTIWPFYLKTCTKVLLKSAKIIWWAWIFEFLISVLFIAQKPEEFWQAVKSKKSKNSKIHSHQVFCTLDKYLCANFQIKRSNNEGGFF